MFFGYGTRSQKFPLDDQKIIVATWNYFHICLCPAAGKIRWYIIGNNRSEDKEISYDEVKQLIPINSPSINIWNKYGLYFVVLIGVLLGIIHEFYPWEQY